MEYNNLTKEDLRKILDALPQLVWSCRADGYCDYLNRRWAGYLGTPETEFFGHDKWLTRVHPDDRKRVRQAWHAAVSRKTDYDIEYRLRSADGVYRWFKTRGTPALDERGRIVRWFGTCTDIEDQKRTEEALRESEEALRTVFNGVYDSIILHAVDGKIVDVNEQTLSMYRVSRSEILKLSIADISSRSNPMQKVNEIWESVMRGQTRFFSWKALRPTDKTEFDVEVFLRKLRIRGRDVIMGNVRDVSERVRAEEALRQSEEHFRLIADSMPQLIWTAQPDGTVDYVNHVYKEYTGAGIDALPWPKVVHPDDEKKMLTLWEESVRKGIPFEREVRVRRADGVYRWHLNRGIPVRDRRGRIIKWYGTATDIHEVAEARENLRKAHDELERRVRERTRELQQAYERLIEETRERELAEDQLRQSQKMEALGTMASGIAHDFNNILAAVVGFTEMALSDLPEATPGHRHLEQVMKASLRARDLIKQMLIFSRTTSQERKPIALADTVTEAVKFIRASLPATIDIRTDIRNRTGVILGDPVQVQQVLMNLAANAADAMQPLGGSLKVVVDDCIVTHVHRSGIKPGAYMVISVSDTGKGMPQMVRERIFDPFFTTKEPGKGTGLGLSVVLGIVKSYGGMISVRSRPGKGTRFRIYLPRVWEDKAEEYKSESSLPRGHERILFVDDEEMFAEAAERMTSDLGYQVTVETSSTEAFKRFRADPAQFDLVITDQVMPEMTGLQLAERILSVRKDIPIILNTGYHPLIDSESVKTAGIRALVMKPLTRGELARTIRDVLDRRES